MISRTHTRQRASARSGAALLIVLGAVVLATTVLSALVATAHRRHASLHESIDAALAGDLLRQCDVIVQRWLTEEASEVVLPPESQSPRVPIGSHQFEITGSEISLTLTAFDQHGMVSLGRAPATLVSMLPADIRAIRDRLDARSQPGPFGLDQIASVLESPTSRPVFPGGDSGPLPGNSFAFGEFIATHGGGDRFTINPNTAPLPLVAAALREAKLGGIEHVMAARSEGKPVQLRQLTPLGDSAGEQAVGLVSSSLSWSVRIDVTIGTHRESWWSVWQRSGSRWTLAQRLKVTP